VLLFLVLSATAAAAKGRKLGAVVEPLRLLPKRSETLAVGGFHDYFGTLELRSASDGLVLVNRLRLERYLLGLNEVPARWPGEALEAQAIAARTYSLWTLLRPRAGSSAVYGFDICATVQCQVFSGADVVQKTSLGERWAEAVRATEGEAVLHGGAPILARYHSTSGGRTFANETIFPSEGAFPYLQSVESETEEGSPVYRWRVRFRMRHLERIVRRAELYPSSAGRLREVVTVPSSTGRHYPDVLLEGRKGRVRVTAEELRSVARVVAPEMFPKRYPSSAPTTSGRLPETFPSNRLTIVTSGRSVEVVGRGWGHGVGMSQWGAEGMSRRGASAEEILGHYYTGTTVGPVADPGRLDVGVGWGLKRVRVSGDFRIVDGRGKTVVGNALGTWTFRRAGTGAVAIDPPHGFGLPLRVGIVGAPTSAEPGDLVSVTIALSRPARVSIAGEGEPVLLEAGRRMLRWRAPEAPGEHELRVVVDDGRVKRRAAVSVDVQEPPPIEKEPPAGRPSGKPEEPRPIVPAAVALALLIAVALLAKKVTIGR
jgi:stage II sporulation protein D